MNTDTTAMNKLFLEFRALCKSFRFSGDELSANLVDFLLEREDVAINEEKEQIIEAYNSGEGKIIGSGEKYYNKTYKII